MDAKSAALGEHEQLGVEEPAVVLHEGQQLSSAIGADRLKAALRVAEPRGERRTQEEVVGARAELALGPSYDVRSAGKARSDREVAVTRQQGRHEGEERCEIGREVDVHVGEDIGVRGAPHLAECATSALEIEMHGAHTGETVGQSAGDRPRAVGARVVGDGDARGVRDVAREEGVEPFDAGREVLLLVVDRNDDVEGDVPGRGAVLGRDVWSSGCSDGHGHRCGVGDTRGEVGGCHGSTVDAGPGRTLATLWAPPKTCPLPPILDSEAPLGPRGWP